MVKRRSHRGRSASRASTRGVALDDARKLLLSLPDVEEGRSYGMPSFKLAGSFFARFRDDDTVLVLQLASIAERDVLIQMEPKAFFFTDHYRDYPAVLIRLAEIPRGMLADVVRSAWEDLHAKRRPKPASRRKRTEA